LSWRETQAPPERKAVTVGDLLHTLIDLFWILLQLLGNLLQLLLAWSLLLAWVAWWLWGVNWRKAWPVLAQGAWVPVLLLVVLGALVWSQIAPSDFSLGFASVPNFWWQLTAAGLLAASALFLGWVQGVMGWSPPEVAIYAEGGENDRDHGHGHGHH
jgi:hypothetical protein